MNFPARDQGESNKSSGGAPIKGSSVVFLQHQKIPKKRSVETHINGKFTPERLKMPHSKSLHIAVRSGIYMGNPLKSVLQTGNSKIPSRSRVSWPAAMAAPVGIETIPQYSEFNEPSPKPCPKNILMAVGQGGGETPSCLRISLFFFMTPKWF